MKRIELLDKETNNILAEGVMWRNNKITIQWLGQYSSIVTWDNLGDFLSVNSNQKRKLNIYNEVSEKGL